MNWAGHLRIKETGGTHILHELAADGPNLFAEGGAEHHALLLMRGQSEDVLDVTSHIYQSNITLSITDSAQRSSEQTLVKHSPSCSSILSHSSRTKCLTFFRLRVLFRTRARIRPGVPTTMWGQLFFRTSSSFLMDMPPKNTATFTVGMYLEKRSYSLLIWKASSRVWHMTSTDTWVTGRQSQLHLLQALQIKFSAPQIIIYEPRLSHQI